MSVYTFSPEKNAKLIDERSISFEEIIAAIQDDQIVDILEHPNPEKYENQKIYVVSVKEYVYLVPFVINADGNIFLKTIIPSRKAKKKYS
ncbi:MAG: BrnT family toxin [Parachlamydiaceae bacterium]|nr:BrnT family toxin [Parachlamydiaceae bacterium]